MSRFTRATAVGYILLACISSSPINERVTSAIFFSINTFLPSGASANKFLFLFMDSTRYANTAPAGCRVVWLNVCVVKTAKGLDITTIYY
jgi:hypothetical protein